MNIHYRTHISSSPVPPLEYLQQRLIKKPSFQKNIFIQTAQQIQQTYLTSKVLKELLIEQKSKSAKTRQNLRQIQRRYTRIRQLSSTVTKQTIKLQHETQKLKQVYLLNKILALQKTWTNQKNIQDIERKREQCSKIKSLKKINKEIRQSLKNKKLEKIRQNHKASHVKEELLQVRCNTMQLNRNLKNIVKQEHYRQKILAQSIQKYKQIRAKKNYQDKLYHTQNQIYQKQSLLMMIDLNNKEIKDKNKQEKQSEKVNGKKYINQCLKSFFTTETGI